MNWCWWISLGHPRHRHHSLSGYMIWQYQIFKPGVDDRCGRGWTSQHHIPAFVLKFLEVIEHSSNQNLALQLGWVLVCLGSASFLLTNPATTALEHQGNTGAALMRILGIYHPGRRSQVTKMLHKDTCFCWWFWLRFDVLLCFSVHICIHMNYDALIPAPYLFWSGEVLWLLT